MPSEWLRRDEALAAPKYCLGCGEPYRNPSIATPFGYCLACEHTDHDQLNRAIRYAFAYAMLNGGTTGPEDFAQRVVRIVGEVKADTDAFSDADPRRRALDDQVRSAVRIAVANGIDPFKSTEARVLH
jgi:hypothetical protein